MSEIGKRIAAIVDEGLTPHLKARGFHQRGVNFFRTDGNALQVVTVQSSQHNYGDSGKFRVNFGVHFPEVAKVMLGSDNMPKVPSEPYCLLRAIGSFPDRWWIVNPAQLLEPLCRIWAFIGLMLSGRGWRQTSTCHMHPKTSKAITLLRRQQHA